MEEILKLLGYLSPLIVILVAQLFKKILSFAERLTFWERIKPIIVIIVGAITAGILKAWGGEEIGSAMEELKRLFGDPGFVTLLAMVIYRLWKVIVKGK